MEEAKRGQEIEIDVEALEMELKRKMSENLTMPSTCSIFRIPTILSRHSPNAYIPNQFSFGPFHRYNKTLNRTEKIKSKYLLDLVSRSTDPDATLKALTRVVANIRKEAREYYAGPIDPMTEAEFVQVLVLDGCFIVELFRKNAYKNLVLEDDPIFSMSCLLQFLWHDLILLENQVPWMVLERLYDLTLTQVDEKPLVELAIEFFGAIFSTKPIPVQPLIDKPHRSKHILDLLRNSVILPSKPRELNRSQNEGGLSFMPSATTLLDSGVKFEACKASASVLDVEFDKRKGVLKIPELLIQETTQTVLRNLIGLEQCCPNYDSKVTSYAVLLDNLINTRADMEILCRSEAIMTWLNIDEATNFFNKLYVDTYVKENFYLRLTDDVNEYCKKPWHAYRRVLMRDYFKHPWAFISVVAAFIALLLAFLQTWFTITKK